MIILKDTNSSLQLISTGGVNGLNYSIDWVDITASSFTPGSTEGNITTATTTTVLAAPAASTQRQVKRISVTNTNLSVTQTVRFVKDISGTDTVLTAIYSLAPNESVNYEDGSGWSVADITIGGTITNPLFDGYADFEAIANPSAPPQGTVRIHARNLSGRMLPKWTPPSGVDTFFQPSFFGNNIVMYMPNTSTTAGINLGTPWAVGTTIGHPVPTPGIYSQIKRTTSTNVVTTTNQVLGVSSIVSSAAIFYRGNAPGLGGFFFFARFGIETLTAVSPNATRLFVGLQSLTTSILASDTVSGDVIGLWHDTTDGADVLNIVTRNNTTTVKNALAGSPVTPYITGQAYDFYLFCRPNDTAIYYRLDNFNTATVLSEGSISSNLPRDNIFMGPVVGMSNGTANIVAETVGIGVNKIYIESDR
jgi:hypothetical protein